ncbi:MAG: DUF362 domain-containing protein [Firmicutes bacterium]|nr:DUF362 domain-containing protein [Bacillota bacterium]
MEKAKVYFTDLRTKGEESLLHKMERLMKKAGFEEIDFQDKFVAVKIHFGEPGNLAYLRPNWARTVCDYIKRLGGKPYLTDCNTLYVGGRKNAIDHLDSAYINGYNPLATGVQTIIADGLKGLDEREMPVPNGTYCKTAKIGSALAEADIVISLSHVKGHVSAGFGGVLKNIGMGGGSRSGKQQMHSDGTPRVIEERCIGCKTCEKNCAHEGVKVVNKKAVIDEDKCLGCGRCIAVCPKDAIQTKWDSGKEALSCKIAEYTWAVIQGKPNFHIAFVMDVSPDCDCESQNDLPIVPDVGIYAGFDPVAIDQACADAVNAQPIIEGSLLGDILRDSKKKATRKEAIEEGDIFKMVHPNTKWQAGLEHAEKLGMGTREYELITVK